MIYVPNQDVDYLLDAFENHKYPLINSLLDQRDAYRLANAPLAVPKVELKFNEGQQRAWNLIVDWLATDSRFFALKGVAGSGKSFMMQRLLELNHNFHFSAPTNKASKVLADFLGQDVKTTYSLLGLRMTADEDKLKLTAGAVPFLGVDPIIVIDEAGQVPSAITDILKSLNYRVLFVGDPAQLNPVGEDRSPAWKLANKNRVLLTHVERFDNQLLALSIAIRKNLKDKNFVSPIVNDNDGNEGVFVVPKNRMLKSMRSLSMDDWRETKVCCWRNKTVDQYNAFIREGLGLKAQYEVGETVLLGSPVVENGTIKGYVDEELTIKSVAERDFTLEEGVIPSFTISAEDRAWSLNVPKNPSQLESILNKRAGFASQLDGAARKRAWANFWDLHNMFHNIRYGYALTCHRLQGTTVNQLFMDQADILANQNKMEAFRALYVAATRPRVRLTTY